MNRSVIGNDCYLNNCAINDCIIENQCGISSNVNLFSTRIESNVGIGFSSNISRSKIGCFSYLSGNNFITDTTIGRFCSIAKGVFIGESEHPTDRLSSASVFYKRVNETGCENLFTSDFGEFKKTILKNDVWVGANAFIKSGVTIHDGVIIGAGAVVTKDVLPYTIIGGVPARLIRHRFPNQWLEF